MENSLSSCYEIIYGNFTCSLDLHQVKEQNQMMSTIFDNMQLILNNRAGWLRILPAR
jgi:type VI secretion system protein